MAVLETKKIGLGKLPQILPKQWLEIGIGLLGRIRRDANKGISQDDSTPKFAEYSTFYKDLKTQGLSVDGIATDSQINPPNLKYTGRMLTNIEITKPRKDGFTITYLEGQRVLENIRMENRNIFDINSKNMDWIANEVVKIFDKNAKLLKNLKWKFWKRF